MLSEPLPVRNDGLSCPPFQYRRHRFGTRCPVLHSETIKQRRAPIGISDPFNVRDQTTKRCLLIKSHVHDEIGEYCRSRCTVEKYS